MVALVVNAAVGNVFGLIFLCSEGFFIFETTSNVIVGPLILFNCFLVNIFKNGSSELKFQLNFNIIENLFMISF